MAPHIDTYEPSAELVRKPILAIFPLSAAVASFLVWLIYFKGKIAAPTWVGALPAANASFNSLSALCLIFGYINIRRPNCQADVESSAIAEKSPLKSEGRFLF
jgi:uncharacterized membrane protein YozB (DUF420 family)